MKQPQMFSIQLWIEPVRRNYHPKKGGVIEKWRVDINRIMRKRFLRGKRIVFKLRLEIQKEDILKQLVWSMKKERLSEERQKNILVLFDIFISCLIRLADSYGKDYSLLEAKMNSFESEYPLIKYYVIGEDLLDIYIFHRLIEVGASDDDLEFLVGLIRENNEYPGVMNLKAFLDFKVVGKRWKKEGNERWVVC